MIGYSLSHLSNDALLQQLDRLVVRDRRTTAEPLAHLAEVDSRKLYLPAGYGSMYAYCTEKLRLSEDGALKRIQAARAGLAFPQLFESIADGRLNLTGACLLAPRLTATNAIDLLAEAAGKSKSQIRETLARRYPATEELPIVTSVPGSGTRHAPAHVEERFSRFAEPSGGDRQATQVMPIADARFSLHLTMSESARAKLQYAQELLSHAIPSGDLAAVLDRALDALIAKLEKRKFAATDRPRRARQASANPRHVTAHVKRAIWRRDSGRCTFIGANGHRCEARHRLEFDHVQPVALGGGATVDNLRLRCRAHNQYEAKRAFGTELMMSRRGEAQARAATRDIEKERAQEVIP